MQPTSTAQRNATHSYGFVPNEAKSNILCLTSSPRRDTPYSSLVAMRVLRELRHVYPDATVTIRAGAASQMNFTLPVLEPGP